MKMMLTLGNIPVSRNGGGGGGNQRILTTFSLPIQGLRHELFAGMLFDIINGRNMLFICR